MALYKTLFRYRCNCFSNLPNRLRNFASYLFKISFSRCAYMVLDPPGKHYFQKPCSKYFITVYLTPSSNWKIYVLYSVLSINSSIVPTIYTIILVIHFFRVDIVVAAGLVVTSVPFEDGVQITGERRFGHIDRHRDLPFLTTSFAVPIL